MRCCRRNARAAGIQDTVSPRATLRYLRVDFRALLGSQATDAYLEEQGGALDPHPSTLAPPAGLPSSQPSELYVEVLQAVALSEAQRGQLSSGKKKQPEDMRDKKQ